MVELVPLKPHAHVPLTTIITSRDGRGGHVGLVFSLSLNNELIRNGVSVPTSD